MFAENHFKPTIKHKDATGYAYSGGYRLVLKPGHPNAISRGRYVREQRLVMEYTLGRYLDPNEHVHHINGDKLDNRAENLKIVTQSEHRTLHNLQDKKYVAKRSVAEIEKLYLQGLSTRDIAEKLDVGKTTVSKWVKRLGIARPQMTIRDDNGNFIKRARAKE